MPLDLAGFFAPWAIYALVLLLLLLSWFLDSNYLHKLLQNQ